MKGDQYDDRIPQSTNSIKEAFCIRLFRLPNNFNYKMTDVFHIGQNEDESERDTALASLIERFSK